MTYAILRHGHPAENPLQDFLKRHAWRLGGLAMVGLAAALLISLATWHVDDPSFSYPVDAPVRNLFGLPGAAFADLAMQFLGFAVIGIVFPLFFWGWSLFRLRRPRRPIHQAVLWFCGLLTLSATFSCLPAMARWPLPTGLGGAVGDLILDIAEWFGGGTLSAGLYAALCVILGGLALGLLSMSCLRRPIAVSGPRRRRRVVEEEEDESEDEDEEGSSTSKLRLMAGIAGHLALSAQAALARGIRRYLAGRANRLERVRSALKPGDRREPLFISDGDIDFDVDFGIRRSLRRGDRGGHCTGPRSARRRPAFSAASEAKRPCRKGGAALTPCFRRIRAAATPSSRRAAEAAPARDRR